MNSQVLEAVQEQMIPPTAKQTPRDLKVGESKCGDLASVSEEGRVGHYFMPSAVQFVVNVLHNVGAIVF